MPFFRFPNHVLKLKELDQPQSEAKEVFYTTLCVSFSSKLKAANAFPKTYSEIEIM